MATLKKKIYVIINPVSGTSSKQNLATKIATTLDQHEFDIHQFITSYAGHGSEIAQLAVDDKADYVIAAGGDGTINEVARMLVGTDTILAIIPMGSGNGLARDLHIPVSVSHALAVIKEENAITIDYGIADNHIFFCTCGVGFDAMVSERASTEKKRGSFMYFKNMLETFIQHQPETYEIICPEGTIKDKALVVTCANATQYGNNAFIAPNADIQDGLMNIAMLKPLNILDVPQTTLQLFSKTIDNNKKLLSILTKEVIIKREREGVMHIDGDPIQAGREIHVTIVPKGLKVLVSKNPSSRRHDAADIITSMLRSMQSQRKSL